MITILMMSAKFATPGFLKIKVFLDKYYDVVTSVHDIINKIFSNESSYIVNVVRFFYFYNIGKKVVNKFTKLSNIGLSMECFTADVFQFFSKKSQNLAFGWAAGYLPSDPSV